MLGPVILIYNRYFIQTTMTLMQTLSTGIIKRVHNWYVNVNNITSESISAKSKKSNVIIRVKKSNVYKFKLIYTRLVSIFHTNAVWKH